MRKPRRLQGILPTKRGEERGGLFCLRLSLRWRAKAALGAARSGFYEVDEHSHAVVKNLRQGERSGRAVRRLGGEPNVRRTCSRVEASSSCVALRVASPRSQRRVAARFRPVQHSSA